MIVAPPPPPSSTKRLGEFTSKWSQAMQIRRGTHGDIAPSPVREMMGVIRTGDPPADPTELHGWLGVTVDVTLFRLVQGVETYDPPPRGSLIDAPIRKSSLLLASIEEYDFPDETTLTWSPVVRCRLEREFGPVFTQILPEAEFVVGLDVDVAFPTPVRGRVTKGPHLAPFLLGHTPPGAPTFPPVMTFEVETAGTMLGTTARGAAVTVALGDETVLVGMVMETFAQRDGSMLLTCHPANLFAGNP